MIIQDEADCRVGGIALVEKFEKLDELPTAVALFDQGVNLAGNRSMPASRLTVPWRLYSWSRAKVG